MRRLPSLHFETESLKENKTVIFQSAGWLESVTSLVKNSAGQAENNDSINDYPRSCF